MKHRLPLRLAAALAALAAVRVRRKPVVRWTRLAGHAAMPAMVEIDDSVPPGLTV